MLKNNRKGFIGVLLNPLVLVLIIIVGLLFMIGLPNSPFKLAIFNTGVISFAGFDWNYEVNQHNPGGSCSGSVSAGETANLNIEVTGSQAGSGCEVTMITKTPINDVDEFLVIFDSTQFAGFEMGSSAKVFITGGVDYVDAISGGKSSFSQYFSPKIIKFRNNFDGTYSVLTSLGVGDVFIVKNTVSVPKDKPLYLGLRVDGGGGAGGDRARSSMTVYNIVRKENAFAVCKADQFIQDKNRDGKITSDECSDLQTIVLNSEEAIKESFDAKLARITAELEAKNTGLTNDVASLKQQLANQQTPEQITALEQQIKDLQSQLSGASDKTLIQQQIDALRTQQLSSSDIQDRISVLEAELKDTKSVLADVQAGDKKVINVISQQEQFEKPNTIKSFFNKIWSWIKSIFT